MRTLTPLLLLAALVSCIDTQPIARRPDVSDGGSAGAPNEGSGGTGGPPPSEGGGGAGGGASDALSDQGLVARYFFDEASTASVPTSLAEATGDTSKALAVGAPELLSTVTTAGRRGIRWNQSTAGLSALTLALANNPIQAALTNKRTFTLEMVVTVEDFTVRGDLIYLGSFQFIHFYLDGGETVLDWGSGTTRFAYTPAQKGRSVLHLVVDIDAPLTSDRARLYVNGALVPALTTPNPPSEPMVFDDGFMRIGNGQHAMDLNPILGNHHYAAMYDVAFDAARVARHWPRLDENDDAM